MSIGGRLKDAREQRFMTQSELSAKSGVQIATISRIENNRQESRPRLTTVRKLSEVLGVEPSWIMFGDERGKTLARMDRARVGVSDTGSYPVEDIAILLGAGA